MATLVIPGVRVETRFDVLPPLPAPSGILGAAGIVDRPPAEGGPNLVGVTKLGEISQLLGPGTFVSMPEVVHALANGVSEVMISPVEGGSAAKLDLKNADNANAVTLRCRSKGEWGNNLRADVQATKDEAGNIIRVSLRLLRNGKVVENHDNLQSAPGQPDDLIELLNRDSRYVVAVDPGFAGIMPKGGTYAFGENATEVAVPQAGDDSKTLFELLPAEDASPDGLSVVFTVSDDSEIDVRVYQRGLQETFTDLVMDPDEDLYLPTVLLTQSRFIRVRTARSLDEGKQLPRATEEPAAFTGGSSPSVDAYRDALDFLSDDPRIDLVLASIEPGRSEADVHQIHQALLAHTVAQADNGAPRIAFGSVTGTEQPDLDAIRLHAAKVRNRRFVLVSPAGADGAVAGMVGRMNPMDSPTFKTVPLHDLSAATYRESQLNRLLGPSTNLLVVQGRAGRGVVVLKGIDTTGDQVSVTRVADQAIRETKAISENFIGRLNSNEARTALRQQIVATFTRMERAGALVPSTDGTDPAFVVDVYSTQQDFAQGIVRIAIAVRPVRAIDYIYATIRVKN